MTYDDVQHEEPREVVLHIKPDVYERLESLRVLLGPKPGKLATIPQVIDDMIDNMIAVFEESDQCNVCDRMAEEQSESGVLYCREHWEERQDIMAQGH